MASPSIATRILWIGAVGVAAVGCTLLAFFIWNGAGLSEGQRRLLYQTDHAGLLTACREVMTRVESGELKPGAYYRVYPRPSAATYPFPQEIFALDPATVYLDVPPPTPATYGKPPPEVTGQRVWVAVGDSHVQRFGVVAYAEDYAGDIEGDVRLVGGLRYYDDRYEKDHKYRQRIEALIWKCARSGETDSRSYVPK